jgi:hypothetical protein
VFFWASASSASAGLVHARCRNVVADAIHAQHPQREENTIPQVGDLPKVLEWVVVHLLNPGGP